MLPCERRNKVDIIVVETLGALDDEASAFFSDRGRRIASVTAEPRSSQTSQYLIQCLSATLQRGNAACVLGTVPTSHGLNDLFYL